MAEKNKKPRISVILGPTASGKTALGLALAKKFNGEVVSADSRQVYKKMGIATAKPKGVWQDDAFVVDGIAHHLMDIIDPRQTFTVVDYKKCAIASIRDIHARGKMPFVVGGTGLYIWALVDNLDIPAVSGDAKFRKELEQKSLDELLGLLQQHDPESATVIDTKNKRRVVRALEVAIASEQSFAWQRTVSSPLFDVLQIGLALPREELYRRIDQRVDEQMKIGLLEETKRLLAEGYEWSLPSMSGIGYKQMGYYIRGEMTLERAVEILKRDTRRYARRQITWFKRDKRIHWIRPDDIAAAKKLVNDFLAGV